MSKSALFALNTMDLLENPSKTDENTLFQAQYPSQSPSVRPIGLIKLKKSRERALEGQNSLMCTIAPDTNPKQTHLRYR